MATATLKAKLTADGRGFQNELKKAQGLASSFATKVGGLFAAVFSVRIVKRFFDEVTNQAAKIDMISKRFGITVERVQELEGAARKSNLEVEDIVRSLDQLSRARAEALSNPTGRKARVFDAFGFDTETLRNSKDVDAILVSIGETIRTHKFGADELAAVTELLGETGSKLIPLFQSGIVQVTESIRAMGTSWSKSVVDPLTEANKQMKELGNEAIKVIGELIKVSPLLGSIKVARLSMYALANPKATLEQKDAFFKDVTGFSPLDLAKQRFTRAAGKSIGGNLKELGGGDNTLRSKIVDALTKPEDEEKAKTEKKLQFRTPSDELAKIGGFIGGTNQARTVEQEQARHLRSIKEHIARIAMRGVKLDGEP